MTFDPALLRQKAQEAARAFDNSHVPLFLVARYVPDLASALIDALDEIDRLQVTVEHQRVALSANVVAATKDADSLRAEVERLQAQRALARSLLAEAWHHRGNPSLPMDWFERCKAVLPAFDPSTPPTPTP